MANVPAEGMKNKLRVWHVWPDEDDYYMFDVKLEYGWTVDDHVFKFVVKGSCYIDGDTMYQWNMQYGSFWYAKSSVVSGTWYGPLSFPFDAP